MVPDVVPSYNVRNKKAPLPVPQNLSGLCLFSCSNKMDYGNIFGLATMSFNVMCNDNPYVKNIQNFNIIIITQRHSYKLIDHTS